MIDGRSKQTYRADAARIWALITEPSDASWRPSVSAAAMTGPTTYRETSRRTGYTTEFTITRDVPTVLRELTVKHVDGEGTMTFALTADPDGTTTLEIVQRFAFGGPRLIQPLVRRFLTAERRAYLADLGRVLS